MKKGSAKAVPAGKRTAAEKLQYVKKNWQLYLMLLLPVAYNQIFSPIIDKNCCSLMMGIPNDVAFSSLAGPIFSPAKTSVPPKESAGTTDTTARFVLIHCPLSYPR